MNLRDHSRQRLGYVAAFVSGSVLAAVGLTAFAANRSAALTPSRQPVIAALKATPPTVSALVGDSNLVAKAAAKLSPSVVDVHTEGKAIQVESSPLSGDPFFRRFFGGSDFGGAQEGERIVPRGAGSGVIISADGYILTNQHVIADAQRMTVQIDGKGYDARVVGSDETTDIAVLKVDPKGARLVPAELGNSDTVHVGDWAIAAGDPLDVGMTVTLGIISAVNRKVNAEGHPLQAVIQTDAAINPGNSGGALANINGQVIAINEAIASPTGAYVGIGFAIPINAARKIAAELIEKGKIVRPYLGVAYAPLKSIPKEARRKVGITLEGDDGAVVTQIYPNSPAARAGLQEYDVILEANRQKITDSESLSRMVQGLKVGDTLALLVSRGGENRLLTATLKERPAQLSAPSRRSRGPVPLP